MQETFQTNMDAFLPLRDVVFNTLRQAILIGELKPGERLMELHLAERLGVSRTPIREAIHIGGHLVPLFQQVFIHPVIGRQAL